MKTLYYAHSKRIYRTRQEKRELKLIKKKFPNHEIVNPGAINWRMTEPEIMIRCKEIVRKADVVICSEYRDHIGRGVFEELSVKTKAKKYLLRKKKFIENFSMRIINKDDWCIRYGKCKEI